MGYHHQIWRAGRLKDTHAIQTELNDKDVVIIVRSHDASEMV